MQLGPLEIALLVVGLLLILVFFPPTSAETVRVGMTMDEVRAILGEPASVAALASARPMSETTEWVYENPRRVVTFDSDGRVSYYSP